MPSDLLRLRRQLRHPDIAGVDIDADDLTIDHCSLSSTPQCICSLTYMLSQRDMVNPGHRVLGRDIFYFPNFLTKEEEEYLVRKIRESPQPLWKRLGNRRLQIWGGDITAKGTLIVQPFPPFVNNFPDIISRIRETGAFQHSPHQGPNHIIMNEYLPGQGIMPHEDGPQYHPVVATISLGSHAVFNYYEYQSETDTVAEPASCGHGKSINTQPMVSVLLEPRSLIISSGEMYASHLHGIDAVEEDLIISNSSSGEGMAVANFGHLQDEEILASIKTQTPLKRTVRYSLTCRDVERVSRLATKSHR
ncbi:unnamed protein product [Cyclocybe aegerita]|uniref:Fe2OG dioxygenase domain-containing protein n=1 Tax=Cyclocybe aegerita TaxID=1973307 RepID=A0A8S0WP59_CYCAE|nr:unnamed protein product [Cyclocybe aegerita]